MVVWITGLSGSGKTTVAKAVYTVVKKDFKNTVFLDGDIIRDVLNNSYGYSSEERLKGAKQVSGICRMLDDEGLIVICATMSLFHEIQMMNRQNIDNYIEVYLDVKLEELIKRDPKLIYKRALDKETENVVGIDIDYESPLAPELKLDNNKRQKLQSNIQKVLDLIDIKLNSKL